MQKLPPEDQSEGGLIRWMRFFGGKSREEFEDMAKQDEYIEEAYDERKKLSADEKKRLEYEARERAALDYNTQMKSARMEGEKTGERNIINKMVKRGMDLKQIAELLEMDEDRLSEFTGKQGE